MAQLTIADFQAGEQYDVAWPGGSVAMTLTDVGEIANAVREAGGFRLEFRGPREPLLPQATYAIGRAGAAHDIFIVPIAQDAQGTRYEAIFN